jgi:glycosyltransferase involved in cell wall biosynthesis
VGGKGRLAKDPKSNASLEFAGLSGSKKFNKYSVLLRTIYELKFGSVLRSDIKAFNPDVIILCNSPILSVCVAGIPLKFRNRYVYWHQDIFSVAMKPELESKFGKTLGGLIHRIFEGAEKQILKRSGYVIPIGNAFVERYKLWNLADLAFEVIPNWAPIDEIFPVERENYWSARQSLQPYLRRIIYSGTLGRKHNPLILNSLINYTNSAGCESAMIVVSEGEGADLLAEVTAGIAHFSILPFQPSEDVSAMLSAADVAIVILEPEASLFSIPSKVLSYFSAGKPVVGLMSPDNDAAQAILTVGGAVFAPTDFGSKEAASWIASQSDEQLSAIGKSARNYAETNFRIDAKVERFNWVIRQVVGKRG